MRRDYEQYFREVIDYEFSLGRFRSFRSRGLFERPVSDLFDLIPKNWRSDARFFLAINMIEMVLQPVAEVSRSEILRPDDEFWPLITADIKQLVERAEQIAEKRGRRYVSGTSVAIALGQLAEKLKTTSLQIWGPDDDEK
jgi:hypothetical protein